MSNVRGDILIKKLRQDKGLTQAQLSEGICSKGTLSRIERGERVPSRWVFVRLMQRLEEDPEKYFTDVVTTEDKRVADLKDELKKLLRDKSGQSMRVSEKLIEILEQDKAFNTKEGQQFLFRSKADLALNQNNYEELHSNALKALIITKPKFDYKCIDEYALTFDEIYSINQIAVAHASLVSIEESVRILFDLKEAVNERHISEGSEMANLYARILYNLTKSLGSLERWEKCLPICDIGVKWCHQNRNSFHFPLFLYNKAHCHFGLGDREEGINILKRVFAIFMGFERFEELAFIKSSVKEKFGVEINQIEI